MRKRSPFRVFLIAVWIMAFVFLSACGGGSAFTQATPTVVPTCIPIDPPNPYSAHSMEEVMKLYSRYMDVLPYNDIPTMNNIRMEAYLRLAKNAEHWSFSRDLVYTQSQMARITVTLLDPAFIQYIILNQYLYNASQFGPTSVAADPTFGKDAFHAELVSDLYQIAKRQELIFLITITFPNATSQTFPRRLSINIPFENIVLINGQDMEIKPSHDDHNLGEPIELSDGYVWGIVGFPLALVQPAGDCLELYDMWNTTLTLEVTDINVEGETFDRIAWTVPYAPLIDHDLNYYPDNQHYRELYGIVTPSAIVRTPAPPTPTWPPAMNDPFYSYWQEMGKFFWYVVITELHH